MVEEIAVDARNIKICPAVIVVVSRGNPHAVAFTSKSGAICDVGKRPIVVVVVQAVIKTRAVFDESRDGGAVGEEDIEISIVVVVKQSHAAEDAVDYRLVLGWGIIENEWNPRRLLTIYELNRGGVLCSQKGGHPRGAQHSQRQTLEGGFSSMLCGYNFAME